MTSCEAEAAYNQLDELHSGVLMKMWSLLSGVENPPRFIHSEGLYLVRSAILSVRWGKSLRDEKTFAKVEVTGD